MSLKKSKQSSRSKPIWRKKAFVVITAVFLMLLLIDLSPLGGNIRFYSKWAECGQKPLATLGSGHWNAGANYYVESPSIALSHPSMEFFCTPIEAERAGYSANPDEYEFPHLESAGEPNPFLKSIHDS